jgi:hypothetical protein
MTTAAFLFVKYCPLCLNYRYSTQNSVTEFDNYKAILTNLKSLKLLKSDVKKCSVIQYGDIKHEKNLTSLIKQNVCTFMPRKQPTKLVQQKVTVPQLVKKFPTFYGT